MAFGSIPKYQSQKQSSNRVVSNCKTYSKSRQCKTDKIVFKFYKLEVFNGMITIDVIEEVRAYLHIAYCISYCAIVAMFNIFTANTRLPHKERFYRNQGGVSNIWVR